MAKKRKIRCPCGTYLETKTTVVAGIKTDAFVCPQCDFTTLTKKQAKKVLDVKKFQELLGKERKIIRVGNAMGITFPERLREVGVVIGNKVKLKAIDKNSLTIEFL